MHFEDFSRASTFYRKLYISEGFKVSLRTIMVLIDRLKKKLCLLVLSTILLNVLETWPKLIENSGLRILGLVAARNESVFIKNCLKALAVYTDAIVFLDDASTDNTLAIVESIREDCHIEKIIAKKNWVRNERADKQLLLDAGRALGGTHFIMIDADEMFSACCAQDQWLRKKILGLKPGQELVFHWVHLWDGLDFYRDDDVLSPREILPKGGSQAISVIFCDDKACSYNENPVYGLSGTIHVCRRPLNLRPKVTGLTEGGDWIRDFNYGLLHFRYSSLDAAITQKIWYMCLELVKKNEACPDSNFCDNAWQVNEFYNNSLYALSLNKDLIKLQPVPKEWLNYDFFDGSNYANFASPRKGDILDWINKYGTEYFKDLDIWIVDWMKKLKA